MTFQTTVAFNQGFGVPGELFNDGPRRAASYILNSASATNNVFGRAFTVLSQGIAQVGNPGGTNVFAGILVNPKDSALQGTTTGTLTPSLTLPNYAQAEILTEGSIIVALPAAANIGDLVIFDNTTGALSTIAPGVALPVGKTFAKAFVDYYTIGAAGLAVITMLNTQVAPT